MSLGLLKLMNSEQQLFLLLGNWNDLVEIMNKGLTKNNDSEFISLVVNKIIIQLKSFKKMDRDSAKKFLQETSFMSVVNNFLTKFPKNEKSNELLRCIIHILKNPESKIFKHKIVEVLYRNNVDEKNDLIVFDFISSLLDDSMDWALSYDVRKIVETLKERNESLGEELYLMMITHENGNETNY